MRRRAQGPAATGKIRASLAGGGDGGRPPELLGVYRILSRAFGPMGWWPADTPFEVMVGAILTQNTAWGNVEKAIANLRRRGAMSAEALASLGPDELAELIRPAGYYHVKTRRLRSFLRYFLESYGGRTDRMRRRSLPRLREELLAVHGIGPETADSILLYALGKPTFVVDAYTGRIFGRIGLAGSTAGYGDLQSMFHRGLPRDASLYNEYHALIVNLGKHICRPRPRCGECPLRQWCQHGRRVAPEP